VRRTARLSRDSFREGMLAALDEGRHDISLKELCASLGVTTGSFYSHYRDMAELHREVAGIWLRDRVAALDAPGDGVRDPLDCLRRALAAAGDTAVRDGAMRRWATAVSASDAAWVESIPAVAEAVAELDRAIEDYLTAAVTDLGFTGREPADLARWLAAALQVPARARDPEGLETVLGVWTRAVAFQPGGPAVVSSDAAPDAIRLYTTASALPQGARQALQHVADLLQDAQHAGGGPGDPGEAQAGRA